MSNAEIAKVLLSLAQMLSVQKENPFKIKAYRRAARAIANLSESIDELASTGADLTAIPGIGKGISGAIREIVQSGGALQQLEELKVTAGEQAVALNEYPLLDPKRVERIFKKLRISTVAELKDRLERGEIGRQMGERIEQHVRQGLSPSTEMLLWDAHRVVPCIEEFLRAKCGAERVEAAGDYRRRVEVVQELSFVVQTENLENVVELFQRYGGRTTLIGADGTTASFQIPTGVVVRLNKTTEELWGVSLLVATGSEKHLTKLFERGHDLTAVIVAQANCRTEEAVYRKLGLQPIPAELREGRDEVELAEAKRLPELVKESDICGELHAHTTSSDGAHTIEQMAAAAVQRGYKYLGITDHSQGLTIARGVSEADLRRQIQYIDGLNEHNPNGIRILKSAEVDILADGSLDYPDTLLKELDYTVCSIHSKFSLNKTAQTERLMRAMDNRFFNILGHATGRRLMKRIGYEVDFERVLEHAKQNGCFFEINSSPERLDISATNARLVVRAGLKIAINTDAHAIREFDYMTIGVQQARRAGLEKTFILNCLPWSKLQRILKR